MKTAGENRISTGSLYLCAAGLPPPGLSSTDDFWCQPPERWTSQKLWSGENQAADHSINEVRNLDLPILKRTNP